MESIKKSEIRVEWGLSQVQGNRELWSRSKIGSSLKKLWHRTIIGTDCILEIYENTLY